MASKLGREPRTDEELTRKLADITPELILWASDDVLPLLIKFRRVSINNEKNSSRTPITLLGQILLAIRKDLGHQNRQIDQATILGTFVNDIENIST